MTLSPTTPIIIGAGQSVDRVDLPEYKAWSASDLAAQAARAALADSQVPVDALRRIDAIATTRTFEDFGMQPALFGKSANFPRSVARRLDIRPRYALWSRGGGNSPQDLVNEFCERVAAGEFDVVLLAGAEAISTVRHGAAHGLRLDFSESPDGETESRGVGVDDFVEPFMPPQGITTPPLAYAIAENARRGRLGLKREDYALDMGRLFAPFAARAHINPLSAWTVPRYTPQELITAGPHNRWVADPYPLHLVARDQVNLGAAILIASRRAADEMGVPVDRRVYLHGYAKAVEKPLFQRPDLGASPAAQAAARTAVRQAGTRLEDMAAFDFYSCFPIAVFNVAQDEFGLRPDEPRGLTVTGGLPFFGGPGNNYSMHAIAEMTSRVRATDGKPGFVGANGGYLSKYSVGIYSADPRPWTPCDSHPLQAGLDAVPPAPFTTAYEGPGRVESYTVHHDKSGPRHAVVAGVSRHGTRFVARSAPDDTDTVWTTHDEDVLGQPIVVRHSDGINLFSFPRSTPRSRP